MNNDTQIKQLVKEKYSEIANQSKELNATSCCGATSACCGDEVYNIMADDYSKLEGYNADADLGLGCGLPTEFAKIKEGDTVIDLGSGAGNDAFVARKIAGEKGKIIADFRGENPVLYSENKPAQVIKSTPEPSGQDANNIWINAFKNNTQSPGSFIYAGPVTETILLGGVALRAGKKVDYDAVNMKITNIQEANKYLVREYREGWKL